MPARDVHVTCPSDSHVTSPSDCPVPVIVLLTYSRDGQVLGCCSRRWPLTNPCDSHMTCPYDCHLTCELDCYMWPTHCVQVLVMCLVHVMSTWPSRDGHVTFYVIATWLVLEMATLLLDMNCSDYFSWWMPRHVMAILLVRMIGTWIVQCAGDCGRGRAEGEPGAKGGEWRHVGIECCSPAQISSGQHFYSYIS